jgi:hypothetical protein
MPYYRKKPVIIEARKLTENNVNEISKWCNLNKQHVSCLSGIIIQTLEGDVLAKFGCYIVKGICGEFYPCRADIFEEIHEEVEQ